MDLMAVRLILVALCVDAITPPPAPPLPVAAAAPAVVYTTTPPAAYTPVSLTYTPAPAVTNTPSPTITNTPAPPVSYTPPPPFTSTPAAVAQQPWTYTHVVNQQSYNNGHIQLYGPGAYKKLYTDRSQPVTKKAPLRHAMLLATPFGGIIAAVTGYAIIRKFRRSRASTREAQAYETLEEEDDGSSPEFLA